MTMGILFGASHTSDPSDLHRLSLKPSHRIGPDALLLPIGLDALRLQRENKIFSICSDKYNVKDDKNELISIDDDGIISS